MFKIETYEIAKAITETGKILEEAISKQKPTFSDDIAKLGGRIAELEIKMTRLEALLLQVNPVTKQESLSPLARKIARRQG